MTKSVPSDPQNSPPLLDFHNITVVRDEKTVLDSVSLTVGANENIAILGPNGSGKSSFIRTITRENYPLMQTGMHYKILGEEVWHVSDLRKNLGIVSADLQFTFTRSTTGRDVILSGFFSSIGLFFHHNVTAEMNDKADKIISFLDIGKLQNRPMRDLSTGEQRRFLIGRALVHEPKALILDEPTSGLDLFALHRFRDTIRKITQSGTGIIMVTHNLHDIIPEISRVVLMKDGRFFMDGKKEDILTDEIIGGLFDVPLKIKKEDNWYYATGY